MGTGGSSSGIGTAAQLLGRPASAPRRRARSSARRTQNMLVGIKPTVGLISRYGIAPITADQDTAGPDDPHGGRRGDHAGRDGRRRSQRSGDQRLHAAAGPRLHALPAAGRPARARASAFRAPASTVRRRDPTPARSWAASTPQQLAVMEEAIAILKREGADDRRSGRHPELRRRHPRPTTSTPSRSAPAPPTTRATTRRARRCSSTA